MKYFAKYLPVEEEIKVGDHFFANGAIRKCIDIKEGDYLYKDETGNWQSKHWSENKRKLFLCNREIEMGDLVVDYDIHPDPREHEADQTCKDKGCIKVIGPISPDATWVKEGDEIEDYRQFYECEKGDECDLYYGAQICSACHNIKRPIEIKGPCGHFH